MPSRRAAFLIGAVLVAICTGIAVTSGKATIAVWLAPSKKRSATVSEASKAANALFWETLHAGRYDEIGNVLEALTAVYLSDPGDAETAAHIGFTHIWKISERARIANPPATIVDELVLARKYFSEAVRLVPDDARFLGFLASAELGEAKVHGDEKLTRQGYFDLMASVRAFPEFNLFTAGYIMSDLPVTDPRFHDALEYQWQTLDLLADEPFDRKTASIGKYLSKETHEGPKRVLWNSWIAPHNLEGFFLNMGDMLVKQGDVATARKIYANARFSTTFDKWRYRELIESRIIHAEQNVDLFRNPVQPRDESRTMMFRSAISCMGCHQE